MSKEIVNALASGDNLEAESEFGTAISTKVGDALETRRKELANVFVKSMSVENEKD